MKTKPLALVLREHAEEINNREDRRESDRDTAELIVVLARIIEGKPIEKAFGAPGDWGYGTPIGDALANFYRQPIQRSAE
jgi:hypothetical protein